MAQAAQLVGVSEQALRKRIRKGTLPAHKIARGNQVVTVLARSELEEVYPGLRMGTQPKGAQPQRNPEEVDEGVVVLREGLARAVAAREAAERRTEAAEVRAREAEGKLERALVQRGDELAKTRKDAERQALQMAMEIARAQIQAQLPESTEGDARAQRRWFGGLALLALALAGGALLWAVWASRSLRAANEAGQTWSAQVVELQERTTTALGRVAEVESEHRRARDELLDARESAQGDRERWEAEEQALAATLAAERAQVEQLRSELRARVLERQTQLGLERGRQLALVFVRR